MNKEHFRSAKVKQISLAYCQSSNIQVVDFFLSFNFKLNLDPLIATISNMTSSPSGADIYVDNHYCGQTPQTLKLTRNTHHICLMKEGYRPDRQKLKSNLSPIVAGNLGFIPIGAGAGAATGAIVFGVGDALSALAILGCAGLGAICGAGFAFGGAVVDCASGGGNDLCSHVHSNLIPEQGPTRL